MQPVKLDRNGIVRFKGNKVIERLFREKIIDLNKISCWDLPIEDVEQFWQLLGYSVSGYAELSFIRDETVAAAEALAEPLVKELRARTK